jgi:hypothetical protein
MSWYGIVFGELSMSGEEELHSGPRFHHIGIFRLRVALTPR